jgi:drug/metabolite transporter (DMT)-like permease
MSVSTKGYLYVLIAAVLWASSGTSGKALFESGIKPLDLVQVRVTFAAMFLVFFLGIFSRSSLKIRWKDLAYFLLLGGVVMTLVQFSYFFTISKIQVVAAILLQYLSPVVVTLFAILFWRERPTAVKLAALVGSLIGCYLVVGGYNLELLRMNRAGIISGLAAAVFYACYALLGEWAMHRYSPWTTVFYSLFFAAFSLNLCCGPLKFLWAGYTYEQWAIMMYIVIFGTILPFGFYFTGINYIRSTRAMITATFEPISAGVMAYFFLGEKLEYLQILGAILVLAAILLLQFQQVSDHMTPDRIRRERNEIQD